MTEGSIPISEESDSSISSALQTVVRTKCHVSSLIIS
nr:MAG TPA: hypothetical protein [Caudoviricetes sp.]